MCCSDWGAGDLGKGQSGLFQCPSLAGVGRWALSRLGAHFSDMAGPVSALCWFPETRISLARPLLHSRFMGAHRSPATCLQCSGSVGISGPFTPGGAWRAQRSHPPVSPCAACCVVFLLFLLRFDARPPTPQSAADHRRCALCCRSRHGCV